MTVAQREPQAPEHLLQMVYDRPAEALAGAERVLATRPSPAVASIAHQTIGLVHREFGDLRAAIIHLRTAVRLARTAGSATREAQVLSTLGIALVHAGRARAGVAALDEAVRLSAGHGRARARFLRGGTFQVLGRHDEALADLRVAIKALRRAGDDIWTARALTSRGLVSLACGDLDRADQDFRAAEAIHAGSGQPYEYAVARWNRGLVAFRGGDLPAALELLDDADRRCRELEVMPPDLVADRCAVLLAAGLPQEALDVADAAAADLLHRRGMATRRAELLFVAAGAAYAAGDHPGARDRATVTAAAFGRQGRSWWREHAVLLQMQARLRTDGPSPRMLASAAATAGRLRSIASPEAVQADLLAGRIALALGSAPAVAEHLGRAAGARHRGPVALRVTGWLARALLAESEGRGAAMGAACRQGLNLLDEYRSTLGATELRARATAQGAELAELAQRAALRDGRPRQLLVWSERWRATACAVPPVRPPDDRAGLVDLVAFREISTRLDQARRNGEPFSALDRERARLERRVRDRAHRTRGVSHAPRGMAAGIEVDELLAHLGDARLVELVAVDGDLHAVVCGGGRVSRIAVGSLAAAAAAVEQARWFLRSVAYRSPDRSAVSAQDFLPSSAPPGSAVMRARLIDVGRRLQIRLLGAAVPELGTGAVVVVPPGRLQGAPWALLPALADRAHAVAPSARAWLAAAAMPGPRESRVVLVRGPGLSSHGAEVDAVAGLHPGARILDGARATTSAVTDALESSSLAHIAAHGEFRAESPLFSSLRMHDGPLTVYDLERLRRAPHRMILPSCDSARLQPVGADEMLGLATALLPLGTAGLVAGVVPVNDAATVPVMTALHAAMAAGATSAEALLAARRSAADDPVHHATACSFIAFGAA